jgi:hypothetical protein
VYLDLDSSLENVCTLINSYLLTFCESLVVTGEDIVHGQTSTQVNRTDSLLGIGNLAGRESAVTKQD